MLRKWGSGSIVIRHPDDVKRFSEEVDLPAMKEKECDVTKEVEDEIVMRNQEDNDTSSNLLSDMINSGSNVAVDTNHEQETRRSGRRPIPNRRYSNDDFE